MPISHLNQQAIAEAIYMKYLLDAAKNAASSQTVVAFDPQGRLLIEVTLKEQDYQTILEQINREVPYWHLSNGIAGLAMALGRKPTSTTVVSLEIPKAQFKTFDRDIALSLTKMGVDAGNVSEIISQYKSIPKGSIIALQQEFHFHLGLACRVYQKKIPAQQSSLVANAYNDALLRVNQWVMDAFANGLKQSVKDGIIDIATLNKVLDKARKKITPIAHVILIEEMAKRGIQKQILESGHDSFKTLAEKTSATANDLLHEDTATGLVTFIEGSENTSHHRIQGSDSLALRQLMTHPLKEDVLSPSSNPRIHIRTPSIDVKIDIQEEPSILDIAHKLDFISRAYHLETTLSRSVIGIKAFTYNLHTALNDFVGDLNGNLQTQGAERILKGAHQYNQRQMFTEQPIFCLVQNISVNGRGAPLDLNSKNPLVKEASLMTELSLLHTLYDASTDTTKELIKKVFEQYKTFLLTKEPTNSYFSQSQHGRRVLQFVKEIKDDWKNPCAIPELGSDGMIPIATLALQRLVAANIHYQHDFAKLTQVLSIYLEKASISGCKSGNERAQAINGRVAILDAIASNRLGEDGQNVRQALIALANDAEHVDSHALALKRALDIAYNRHGLQGAASLISLVDQGAAAKVKARTGSYFEDSNYAEEHSSVMSYLKQDKASEMQAHKGLPAQMQHSIDSVYGASFLQRMKDLLTVPWKSPLFKIFFFIPIIANLAILIASPVIAIVNGINNDLKEKQRQILIANFERDQEENNSLVGSIEENNHPTDPLLQVATKKESRVFSSAVTSPAFFKGAVVIDDTAEAVSNEPPSQLIL